MTEYLARVPSASGPLDAFIRDLALLHERYRNGEGALVEATRLRLAELVGEPDVLPAAARQGSADRYTQHVLPVSADRSHSVVALVWYPGQSTPIHDHVSWCVVGVYEGEESRTRYRLAEDAGERCLVESGRETAGPGSCTSLIPPTENIHRVANAGTGKDDEQSGRRRSSESPMFPSRREVTRWPNATRSFLRRGRYARRRSPPASGLTRRASRGSRRRGSSPFRGRVRGARRSRGCSYLRRRGSGSRARA